MGTMEGLAGRMTELLQATIPSLMLRDPAGYSEWKYKTTKSPGEDFFDSRNPHKKQYDTIGEGKYEHTMDEQKGTLVITTGRNSEGGLFTGDPVHSGMDGVVSGYTNLKPIAIVQKLIDLGAASGISVTAAEGDSLTINAGSANKLREFMTAALPVLEEQIAHHAETKIIPARRHDRIERMKDRNHSQKLDRYRTNLPRLIDAAERYAALSVEYRNAERTEKNHHTFNHQMTGLETTLIDGFRAYRDDTNEQSVAALARAEEIVKCIATRDTQALKERVETLQEALESTKTDKSHAAFHSR